MIRVDAPFSMTPRNLRAKVAGRKHGQVWCHMFADTPAELAELHRVADAIGLKRAWFQAKASLPHYDLVPTKRVAALQNGATEATREETVAAIRLFRASPIARKEAGR
jgi:hypothetical protein